MQVTVPLWVMTWSNTYFTPVNVFFFFLYTLSSCESIFLVCVLCCLKLIDIFHILMHLMLGLDQWNEYVCMYVRKPGTSSCRLVTIWTTWRPIVALLRNSQVADSCGPDILTEPQRSTTIIQVHTNFKST